MDFSGTLKMPKAPLGSLNLGSLLDLIRQLHRNVYISTSGKRKKAVILSGHVLVLDSLRQGQFYLDVAVRELDPSGNNRRTERESV